MPPGNIKEVELYFNTKDESKITVLSVPGCIMPKPFIFPEPEICIYSPVAAPILTIPLLSGDNTSPILALTGPDKLSPRLSTACIDFGVINTLVALVIIPLSLTVNTPNILCGLALVSIIPYVPLVTLDVGKSSFNNNLNDG